MLRKASTTALQMAARERGVVVPAHFYHSCSSTGGIKDAIFSAFAATTTLTSTTTQPQKTTLARGQRNFGSYALNHNATPFSNTTAIPSPTSCYEDDHTRRSYHHFPQPLAAVAYDYDDNTYEHDDDGGYDDANGEYPQHTYDDHPFFTSSRIAGGHGGGREGVTGGYHSHGIYPPPSRHNHSQSASYHRNSGGGGNMGGGGGTGRHRCPKCGTTVTFRSDLEDNTFYCASCSGWFVADPRHVDTGYDNTGSNAGNMPKDGSSYEEFLAKNNSNKKGAFTNGNGNNTEILMRHVSFLS
jgi:hypothetical protein